MLVVLHVHRVVPLSPVDELMHFDNLVRSSKPDLLVAPSDPVDQETMREVACREEHVDAWRVAPANDSCLIRVYEPDDFAWEGLNPSIGHGPLYYLTTGVAARVLRALVPAWGLLTWSRLLGAAWVVAGCYVTLRAARTLGLKPWAVVPGLAALVVAPGQLAASTMVNPDAAMILVGATMMLVAIHYERGRPWATWALPVAAAASLLVDPGAVVVLLLVVLWLALRAARARGDRSSMLRLGAGATCVVLAAFASLVGWSAVHSLAGPEPDITESPLNRSYTTDTLPIRDVLGRSAVLAMFPPVHSGHEPAELRSERVQTANSFVVLVIVGALVGTVLRPVSGPRTSDLAAAAALALLVAGPLMVVRNYLVSRWYFTIPSRYGLSALPAIAIVISAYAGAWRGRLLVSAVAGAAVLATVTSLA